MGHQIFLLSPANLTGKRAGYLAKRGAPSPLAARLRNGGAPVGEIFSFVSGLYFRGKLAYALAFARPPQGVAGVQVIVPGLGLCPHDTVIDVEALRTIARVRVDLDERRYVRPLARDLGRLAAELPPDTVAILLGSLATTKYLHPLSVLGPRLHYPTEFVGRGDMSRGALMLKCAAQRLELTYTISDGQIPSRGNR